MLRSKRVVLIGNANVGKSTVFNEITASHQHTGNWTGKTVGSCTGKYKYKFTDYELVDLPGTYSLLSSSEEERVARDYLCFEEYDCVVCVVDATNLERNLNLVLQVMELTDKVALLINLCDEAKKKNIKINAEELSKFLGVPVICATARSGKGINELLETVHCIANGTLVTECATLYYSNTVERAIKQVEKVLCGSVNTDKNLRFFALRLLENDSSFNTSFKKHFGDGNGDILQRGSIRAGLNAGEKILVNGNVDLKKELLSCVYENAEMISDCVVSSMPSKKERREQMLDRILLGKFTSIPFMLLLFGIILWITIAFSNYPSQLLRNVFSVFEIRLADTLASVGVSDTIISLAVNGIIRVLLWVVAVMLPPMAIFFPLFALAEDFGILPRIAFNLDGMFEKCGACGKQALTTCMGYGCNAVGVTGARIIDSKRERLVAIVTNSLSPCNGRFPLLIAMISMFFCNNTFAGAGILLCFISFSMLVTFAASKILTKTALKGAPSSFVLELPPYRKPKIFSVIVDTVREKILFVLLRALAVSIPSGLIIWLMANVNVGGVSLLSRSAEFLNPIGSFIGLDGVLLLAFILGLPANEIVIPIALMTYLSTGELSDYSNLSDLKSILINNGWTWVTALCTCIFSMFHFPCSTTLITVYKETKSIKYTLLSIAVPLSFGVTICALVNFIFG